MLSEIEKQEVEVILDGYDAIKLELLEIQEALEFYAILHSVEPPQNIFQSVAAATENMNNTLENTIQTNPPTKNVVENSIPSIVSTKRIRNLQYLTAAATILLILSAALNWKYHTQLKEAKTEIALLNQEKESISDNFNSMQAKYNVANLELNVLQNPDNRIIKMAGNENHPESLAYVYWNVESQEVYVKVAELPTPPSEKQYQLWALKDGKPIDAGVFNVETGILKVKNIEAADAFAVTLENKGGSEQPTLEQLYVVGEVKLI